MAGEDDAERLVVLLEARIRDFEKSMQKASGTADRSYGKMRRDSKGATAAMEADMLRSTSRINQALAASSLKIGAYAKSFGAGLIGGLAAGGVSGAVRAVRGLVKEVASLGDEAARAGVNVRVFQEWKAVATATRVPIDALVDGFKELNIRADEFVATGKGSAAEAFGRLGMSREDVQKRLKDPAALMQELIDRTRKLKDVAAGTRIFDEVFGGTGAEQLVRLLKLTDGEIGNIINSAREAGGIFDEEMIRKADEMDRQWNNTWHNWELAAKVAIFNTVDFITQLDRKLSDLGSNAGNADIFARLAKWMDGAGLTDPSIVVDWSKVDAQLAASDVADMEKTVKQLEAHVASLIFIGEDATAAQRKLAQARANLQAEIARIMSTTGQGATDETTLPAIKLPEMPDNATKFLEDYRKALALTSDERTIAAETQRILNDAQSQGIRITEDQAKALATEKAARDDAEKAATKKLRTDEQSQQALENLILSTTQHIDELGLETDLLGVTGSAAEALRVEQELMNAAMKAGVEVTPQLAAKFADLADQAGAASQAFEAARLTSDLLFERQQMGRSDTDQRIYAELRRANIDIGSETGQRLALEISINEQVARQQEQYDGVRDTLAGMVDLLYESGDITDKLISAFAQMGKAHAPMDLNTLMQALKGEIQ